MGVTGSGSARTEKREKQDEIVEAVRQLKATAEVVESLIHRITGDYPPTTPEVAEDPSHMTLQRLLDTLPSKIDTISNDIKKSVGQITELLW
jgi:hypothetical protein